MQYECKCCRWSEGSGPYGENAANFLRTGSYSRSEGYINNRVAVGYWWLVINHSSTHNYGLVTGSTYILPQNNYFHGLGFAVRCVVREG